MNRYPGYTTIWLARPGGFGERPISCVDVAAEWSIIGDSQCSIRIPSQEAAEQGISNWLGRWVRWEHPTLGTWGGVITDDTGALGDSVQELTATSMHWLLESKRTASTYRGLTAPAGALWLRAMQDCSSDAEWWISDMQADEDGPFYFIEWRGDSMLSVTDYLTRANDDEMEITVDSNWRITAAYRHRVGINREDEIVLIEGRDILDGTIRSSLDGVVNDVLAVANERGWRRARKRYAVDGGSIDTYGRIQETRRYAQVPSAATLLQFAKRHLEYASAPIIPLSVEVPATNAALAVIRGGDTVRVWLPSRAKAYSFRVVSRATSSETGTATLSGIAEVAA